MPLAPKRESVMLLIGDLLVFIFALWAALALRLLQPPTVEYFLLHFKPFIFLFLVWILVFFVAGLYSREVRFLQSGLPERILFVQSLNVSGAALFFFLSPQFGIAPKTVLALYLAISSACILLWRAAVFSLLRPRRRAGAVLIGTGADAQALVREVNAKDRYPLSFTTVIDTATMEIHQVVQQLFRCLQEKEVAVIVADPHAPILAQALPLIYDAAFRKRRFVFVPIERLYQDVFDCIPLSSVEYDWILKNLNSPPQHAILKRTIDIVGAIILGAIVLLLYPFIALAIKLEDGGDVLAVQERVGRLYRPVRLYYFRRYKQKTAESNGNHKKKEPELTRVGAFLKRSHLDELPLVWSILRGDLSFVGPQPENPSRALQYASRIPYYNARYLVAPGFTGWARVMREDTAGGKLDVEGMKRVLAYDLYYLQNRSLMLDIYILVHSMRIALSGRVRKTGETS